MPLPAKIQEQKDYMTDAINKLREIEVAERLFKEFYPTYLQVLKENLLKEYAEIMSMLSENLLSVGVNWIANNENV